LIFAADCAEKGRVYEKKGGGIFFREVVLPVFRNGGNEWEHAGVCPDAVLPVL
jgi:hypothetical protein